MKTIRQTTKQRLPCEIWDMDCPFDRIKMETVKSNWMD